MKKIYFIALFVLSALYVGCGGRSTAENAVEQEIIDEQIEVATVEEEEVDDGIADIPFNERHNNHNSFDIETFTIGDYIFIYKYSYMIGNDTITVLDKQGKLIAIAANAQQEGSYGDFIRFLYDDNGNHIGFAQIGGEACYPENLEIFNKPYEGCSYFDSFYYDVCVREPDDVGLRRYMFRYDDAGVLSQICDPIHGLSLQAPEGAHIKWRIEESASFWMSDLRGGEYYLMFYIMPMGATFNGNNLSYDVYDGYEPYDYENDGGQE